MDTMVSRHDLQSAFFNFENRWKSHEAKFGEYDGWAMTFVSSLVSHNYTRMLRRIHVFWNKSSIDSLYIQNINQNVLSLPIINGVILCYISDANTTISFYAFFEIININDDSHMKQVFDDFTTFTDCFVQHKYCTNIRDKVDST